MHVSARLRLKGLIFALFAGASNLCAPGADAYFDDYFPLRKSELKPFASQYVGQLRVGQPLKTWSAGQGKIQVQHSDQEIRLSGQSSYKSYRITLDQRAYEVYRADFDNNGSPDFVLAYETMGNGMAPSSHLLFILFDAQGEPFPFAADGYFDYDSTGIADLVDLNQDGKAELLYMSYDNNYWITQIYQAQAGRWQSIRGHLTGSTTPHFPLYTAFNKSPNRQASSPRFKTQPFGPDLSNVTPKLSGRLTHLSWADVQQSEDISLKIQTAQQQQICQPLSWYSTFSVVVDDERSRRVAFLSAESASQALLQEAVQGKYQANLYGQRTAKHCSPELLWASSKL